MTMKIVIVEEDSVVWDEVEFKSEDLNDTGIRCILLEVAEDLKRLKSKLTGETRHLLTDKEI